MTAPAAPRPLLVDAVSVRLGSSFVVDGVGFALEGSELAWLSGPNGAGKSTLLRALVGLLPFDGDVEIMGAHPRSLAARAAFVFVPDEPALYEDLSLAEHVAFTALLYRRPESEREMLAWLERFGLLPRLLEAPLALSRGQRQKLALALALGLRPALLVLDEPYNGLDADAQAALSRGLKARAQEGGAVLLSAHQAEVTASLGARVLELEAGRLRGDGDALLEAAPRW